MKKLLLPLVAAFMLQGGAAYADNTVHLHEDFASGATFDGDLTFSSSYDTLLDVSGILAGGSYGTSAINWAWWVGTGQPATAIDWDGNPATFEDWMMEGSPSSWSHFIGISWFYPVGGQLTLNLTPDTLVYHAGVDNSDPAVRYSVGSVGAVPEPQTYALMLAGIGALAFVARRRKPD